MQTKIASPVFFSRKSLEFPHIMNMSQQCKKAKPWQQKFDDRVFYTQGSHQQSEEKIFPDFPPDLDTIFPDYFQYQIS